MYDLVPAHRGSGLATGAEGRMVLPQLSVIVGGVGAMASVTHATVEAPFGGRDTDTTGAKIV